MKTIEKKEKSVLQELRDIRDKLSEEIKDMSYEELLAYIDKQETLHPKANWSKVGNITV